MKKIISLIVFAVFYVLSFYTCNFPYPEYTEHPLANLNYYVAAIIENSA